MNSLCIVRSQAAEPIYEKSIRPKILNVLSISKGHSVVGVAQARRVEVDKSKSLMLDKMSIRVKSTYLCVTSKV